MRVKHPAQLPCSGELMCIPVEDCPDDWVLSMTVLENPSVAEEPILRERENGYVIVEFPEKGDFQLKFDCCPP